MTWICDYGRIHRNNQNCNCADNVCSKCGMDLKHEWLGTGKNKIKLYEKHVCDFKKAEDEIKKRALQMVGIKS
jgi:hypothetical protein